MYYTSLILLVLRPLNLFVVAAMRRTVCTLLIHCKSWRGFGPIKTVHDLVLASAIHNQCKIMLDPASKMKLFEMGKKNQV
jgi:hypothetical protein